MGCGTSATGVAYSTTNTLTQAPSEWVQQLRLLPASQDAVLTWCDKLSVGEMGDLAFAKDPHALTELGRALPEIQRGKVERGLTVVAEAIHEAEGAWPAWAAGGTVDCGGAGAAEPTTEESRMEDEGRLAEPVRPVGRARMTTEQFRTERHTSDLMHSHGQDAVEIKAQLENRELGAKQRL